MKNKIIPQQYAGTRPPKGWVPPLGQWLTLLGAYDNDSGYWVGLPLQVFSEQLVLAEKQHALDRIDSRNGKVSVTVPVGTAIGASLTGEIEVPDGEIWYLRGHEIKAHEQGDIEAGDLVCNFRVSRFPTTDEVAKLYYSTDDRLTVPGLYLQERDVTDHKQILIGLVPDGEGTENVYREEIRDFANPDELGTALRLVGGDKLTLVVTVETAAIAGGAVIVDLTVWGLRGKRLVS